jgi:hypothetical protein
MIKPYAVLSYTQTIMPTLNESEAFDRDKVCASDKSAPEQQSVEVRCNDSTLPNLSRSADIYISGSLKTQGSLGAQLTKTDGAGTAITDWQLELEPTQPIAHRAEDEQQIKQKAINERAEALTIFFMGIRRQTRPER